MFLLLFWKILKIGIQATSQRDQMCGEKVLKTNIEPISDEQQEALNSQRGFDKSDHLE